MGGEIGGAEGGFQPFLNLSVKLNIAAAPDRLMRPAHTRADGLNSRVFIL